MKKCFTCLLAYLLVCSLVTGCSRYGDQSDLPQTDPSEATLADGDVISDDPSGDETETPAAKSHKYIIHAGGITPGGFAGSNSLEALTHTYENGYRVIEIDFCWTEDNHLVCVHDWDAYYAHDFGKECITLEEFESVKTSYGFTSLSLYDLADWMLEHEDAVIVTDIKERSVDGARMISELYPSLLGRFYFQIYSKSDYDAVRSLGFENIILTVYQLTWNEKTDTVGLVEYALSHDLIGLTYPIELHNWNPDYTATLLKANTPLYVHTVNDAQIQNQLFDAGVFGVYTDNVGD